LEDVHNEPNLTLLSFAFFYKKNRGCVALLQGGRIGAWVVAVAAVAVWNYYEKKEIKEFTTKERDSWNESSRKEKN